MTIVSNIISVENFTNNDYNKDWLSSSSLFRQWLGGSKTTTKRMSTSLTPLTFENYYHHHYNNNNNNDNIHHSIPSLLTKENLELDILFDNVTTVNNDDDHPETLSPSPSSSSSLSENFTDLESIIGPVHDSYSIVILMTIVYILILLTGVTGNLITCIVIAKKRYMHTATNYYLFSLAVSDLLLLILGLPHDLVLLWQKYPYIFGESFCIIRGLSSELSTNASILTIIAFTIERYIAICHPLRSHTTLKLSRVVKTIIIIWIISALCAVPISYQFGIVYILDEKQQPYPGSDHCAVKSLLYAYIFEIATMVFFVIPICIITILYILIGIKLRASSKSVPENNHHHHHAQPHYNHRADHHNPGRIKFVKGASDKSFTSNQFHNKRNQEYLSMSVRRQNASRRAVIKMLVAVVIAFFFCYSPFHAQRVMAIVMARNNVTDENFIQIFTLLTHISGITYYLSSTINPILYQIMSKKFQLALRETLPCFKKANNHHDLDLAYSTTTKTNSIR